jgi:predicted Zn-dependent protease
VSSVGRKIVERLDPPQPFDYRFAVVRDSTLNAFAVPGGFVYVNSGILLRITNDAELAGVLAHEIGHSHAHHVVRQQEKSQYLSYAAIAGMLLGMLHPAASAVAVGASTAQQLQYSREFEQEADFLAVRYMRAAGYDPQGMVAFMKELWKEQRQMPLDQIPPYMLTHPLTDERLVNLEAATKDTPAKPGWDCASFDLRRAQTILRAIGEGGATTMHARAGEDSTGPPETALAGIARLYGGDARAAIAPLEKAHADGFTDADSDLGLALYRTGDADGAMRVLRGRVEAAPDDAVARETLGTALLAAGRYPESARELERVREIAPELDQAAYDLGQAYGRSGKLGEGFYQLAQACEMRGDVAQAITQYDKAEKLLPPTSDEGTRAKQRAERLRELDSNRHLVQ